MASLLFLQAFNSHYLPNLYRFNHLIQLRRKKMNHQQDGNKPNFSLPLGIAFTALSLGFGYFRWRTKYMSNKIREAPLVKTQYDLEELSNNKDGAIFIKMLGKIKCDKPFYVNSDDDKEPIEVCRKLVSISQMSSMGVIFRSTQNIDKTERDSEPKLVTEGGASVSLPSTYPFEYETISVTQKQIGSMLISALLSAIQLNYPYMSFTKTNIIRNHQDALLIGQLSKDEISGKYVLLRPRSWMLWPQPSYLSRSTETEIRKKLDDNAWTLGVLGGGFAIGALACYANFIASCYRK